MINKYKKLQNYLFDYMELGNGKFEFKKNGYDNYFDESDKTINEKTSDLYLEKLIEEHQNVVQARRVKENFNFYHLRARDKEFCETVETYIQNANPENGIRVTGFFYYPENSYMGWHTNSNMVGTRTYLSWVDKDHKSFFKYLDEDTGEVITKWEKKGWNINKFKISNKDLYWHCVGSKCNRVSLGFNIE